MIKFVDDSEQLFAGNLLGSVDHLLSALLSVVEQLPYHTEMQFLSIFF